MKTVILNIEYFSKGKVRPNKCILKITPGLDPVINNIGFLEPVYNLSYSQLLDINEQIQNAVFNFADLANVNSLTFAGPVSALAKSEKGVNGIRSMAEKMALKLEAEGELSEKEKGMVSKAFELIGEFLGPKK